MPTSPQTWRQTCAWFILTVSLMTLLLLGLRQLGAHASAMRSNLGDKAVITMQSGIITTDGQHFLRDGVHFKVKGVNYYPKDFAWERFWISYTSALPQITAELDIAKELGINTLRIFLPYRLFAGTDQSAPYLGHLADFINHLQAHQMVAIITLFDLYTSSSPAPYAIADYLNSTQHIQAVVNTLGITNPTVLAWDLKNELDRDYAVYGKDVVQAWATGMLQSIRELDPNHLVTIGFYGVTAGTQCNDPTVADGLVYDPAIAADFAEEVDFVSMHYFLPEGCFEDDLPALQTRIGDKPLLLEEFGLHTTTVPPTSCAKQPDDPACTVPHTETEQAAYYNALLALSEAQDIAGILFWTLTDFSYILPGLPVTEQCLGILRNSRTANCQATTATDYAEKPAAAVVRRHLANEARYLDLFDGWVDANTDDAPVGWSDSWQDGGALARGYDPSRLLWSHQPGQVAISKFVTTGVSINGLVRSPLLRNVAIDQHPILAGQIAGYAVRDTQHGSDAVLHIGVQEGDRIVRLFTVTPEAIFPITFAVDLRAPPIDWRGRHNFQIVLELAPKLPNNGCSATYELDWIAIKAADCTELYNPGNGWIIEQCATDPNISTPMAVVLNGASQGPAALVRIYHQSQHDRGTPQVAVLYASGFVRLKPNADPDPPIPFGSSFVLGPAYWPNQTTYHHNPQLTSIELDTSQLPSGPLRMLAKGHNQDFAVSYAMTLPRPRDRQTRLHVHQIYTATADIAIDAIRRSEAQGFKLVQTSSMFINEHGICDGGQTDCHDSNAIRFIGKDLARHERPFANLTPSSFILNSAQPLGNTWLDVLHTDNQGWQGNTPNVRIALDALPDDHTITPQGWIQATSDPNNDNVGIWLHDDGPTAQHWTAGQHDEIDYWLLAQDDPPEPWDDLGLRSGQNLLDFESNHNCFFVHDINQQTSGAVQIIAGYRDSALQLDYDLGNTNRNWVQVRCNFDPPLNLSAYDHLRFDWRGDPAAANSLEIALVNPGASRDNIFGRGLHHLTQRGWWGQLVLPFEFLPPWTPDTVFDPGHVSAFFVSVVKDGDDLGGTGSFAIDNVSVFNVAARSVPSVFEPVEEHPTAPATAAHWLAGQQRATGLLKSWTEETICVAHTYDQALALLVFVQENMWPQADAIVQGLAATQNADGSWFKSYNCDNTIQPVHANKWEGDIAWAIYALGRYVNLGGKHPQAVTTRDQGALWLKTRLNSADGCLLIDHTEATIDTWWALQSAGPNFASEAEGLQRCLLTYYWDDDMGRFKGGRDWQQPYLDNQTWGAAFLKASGEQEKALRALSYARSTLLLPAQGGQLFGLDGQAGPWSVWNEGTAQFIALGGEGGNDLLQELLSQQTADGAMPGAPDNFDGGGVWTSRWHGVSSAAWFYLANKGGPFTVHPSLNTQVFIPFVARP